MSTTFSVLEKSGVDPIINLMIACGKDQNPKKIDLSVGVYKNEDCDPNYVFPCVKAAKEVLLKNDPGHYYTQLEGIPEYLACAKKTIFGIECPNATSVQAIAGSGALHVACTLLKSVGFQDFYIGVPTWGNYRGIIEGIGGNYLEYPYYNYKTRNVDMESFKQTIKNVKTKSVFILQTACHNPTACDLSHEQWKEAFDLILSKGHFLVFDNAYQGLSSGNMDEDAWPIREAYLRKMEFIVCQTYSKNVGLYSERVGCIHVCTWDLKERENVESKLIAICRNEVSFPPAFGSRIVALVATDPELKKIWAEDVLNAAARLKDVRKKALDWFTKLKTPGDWTHITGLSGLFWFSGLSKLQTQKLIEDHHIYVLSNGRINVAGLNNANVEYFCRCVDRVVRDYPVA